jgi:hypothetical protein
VHALTGESVGPENSLHKELIAATWTPAPRKLDAISEGPAEASEQEHRHDPLKIRSAQAGSDFSQEGRERSHEKEQETAASITANYCQFGGISLELCWHDYRLVHNRDVGIAVPHSGQMPDVFPRKS